MPCPNIYLDSDVHLEVYPSLWPSRLRAVVEILFLCSLLKAFFMMLYTGFYIFISVQAAVAGFNTDNWCALVFL